MDEKLLQYVPFSSALDGGFWHKLTQNKLEEYHLDESAKELYAFYSNGNASGIPSTLNLEFGSFSKDGFCPPRCLPAYGHLHLLNTLDAFKQCDKKQLLQEEGQQLWNDITSGAALKNPALLSRFLLLVFADLKKYHYYYWFAFQAFFYPERVIVDSVMPLSIRCSSEQISTLQEAYDSFIQSGNCASFFVVVDRQGSITLHLLEEFETLKASYDSVMLAFSDPSTLDNFPGWPLRNLLTLVAVHWSNLHMQTFEVLCYRERVKDGKRDSSHSIVIQLAMPEMREMKECPKVIGWEKNERRKLGPRMVNLSLSMDPAKLAESAVDLNLKLMRWRLIPSLDLDRISKTRCLLLGAGTLGCNVARCLLAWGVRTITLVDNSKISYSNPVRQSLFRFEDCLRGGKSKAETAAESLKAIFPGVNARGLSITIPMPGHVISETAVKLAEQDVNQLEELIESHDVVFLLLDTREGRWLPTLIATSKQKLVINAALGFDTYMIVRHGLKCDSADIAAATPEASGDSSQQAFSKPIHGSLLGCYFCNDVVAPGDSTRDRTLDQQCTVSRPGMSMVVGAVAVELLVTLLHHPDGGFAPADISAKDDHFTVESASPLGLVPHQIRGFLSRYHTILPASQAFDKCTACSAVVLKHYKEHGFAFLLKVFNEPNNFLEDLTGLTQLHQQTHDMEVWEMSDDDEFCDS